MAMQLHNREDCDRDVDEEYRGRKYYSCENA
jgi:hypothetical protein